MANHNPKGRQKMAALGRVGGIKSGESRRNRATELRMYRAVFLGAISAKEAWESTPAEIAARCQEASKPNRGGGSHDDDWRYIPALQQHQAAGVLQMPDPRALTMEACSVRGIKMEECSIDPAGMTVSRMHLPKNGRRPVRRS
jgi:hypothetical protein